MGMELAEELHSLLVEDAQEPVKEEVQDVADGQLEEEVQTDLADGQETDPAETVDAQPEGDSESLNDLLDSQDIDKEWFYGRKVTIAGSGDDREEMSISEAINAVQDVRRRESQIARREQEIDAEIRKRASQPQAAPANAEMQQAYGQLQALQGQYNTIDQREDLDPGEKANAKLQIGTAYQQVQGQIQGMEQAQQQQSQQAMAEGMQRRNQAILARVESWKDPKVMTQESNAIYEVGRQYGITDQEINSTPDPRMILMMRDHAKLLAKQGAAASVTKKLRKAPSMGGGTGRTGITDTARIDALHKRAKAPNASKGDKFAAMKAEAKRAGLI